MATNLDARLKISCYETDDVCEITDIFDHDRDIFLLLLSDERVVSDRKALAERYVKERRDSLGFAIVLLILPALLLPLFEHDERS